jgi:hypothetical protein
MNTITADGALLSILRKANGPVEIRDEDGAFVGVFSPVGDGYAVDRTPEEWAEMDRRAQNTGGRTLKEIFQRMQALTQDESVRARLQESIDRMDEEDRCPTP